MTSREFYKKTSEMAYQINLSQTIDDENVIVGKIGFTNKTRDDALMFLMENNFFAVDCNTDKLDIENVSFVLEFHYGIDSYDAFMLNVCDVIDCREAGGRLVLSCTDDAELIHEERPAPKSDVKCEHDGANGAPAPKDKECSPWSIFDALDEFCTGFPKFGWFPKLPDFDKMVENMKKNGDTRFYNYSCTIGPDGKVCVKKSTNEGTVEKTFTLGQNGGEGKKVEIKDNDNKTSDSVKRLKDVL